MVHMKRKNAGLSTVEIIVTAVIVVLVIAGVLIAVKFSGKGPADDGNEAKSKELAETQLDGEDQKVLVTVDEAYWQIVSIANKLRLTEKYVDFHLTNLLRMLSQKYCE